jgi:hypothetical protein
MTENESDQDQTSPEPAAPRPEPPPFNPDFELIGYIERGQKPVTDERPAEAMEERQQPSAEER